MLDLVKLYSLANPNHAADIKLAAIKRKFLNGISPDLRRNIFVFCNNPFEGTVTRENLLSYCNNARMHLTVKTEGDSVSANASETVMLANCSAGNVNEEGVIAAINNLTLQVKNHVESTERRFDEVGEVISVLNSNYRGNTRYNGSYRGGKSFRGSYRGGSSSYRGANYSNRGGSQGQFGRFNSNRNRGSRGASNRGQFICFKCGKPNHRAVDCLSPFSESDSNQGN